MASHIVLTSHPRGAGSRQAPAVRWGATSATARGPLVAGLAALLLASSPGLSPAEVKTIVETSAEDMVEPRTKTPPDGTPTTDTAV